MPERRGGVNFPIEKRKIRRPKKQMETEVELENSTNVERAFSKGSIFLHEIGFGEISVRIRNTTGPELQAIMRGTKIDSQETCDNGCIARQIT